MTASNRSIRQIIGVLEKFMPDPTVRRELAAALYTRVEGNASLRATLHELFNVTAEDAAKAVASK
jgi:hypothetical protein